MRSDGYHMLLFILLLLLVIPGAATLEPKGPPKLISMPVTDLEYKEGETMKISCLMTSRPRPILYWYRHGRQIWPHHSPRYNISRTTLVISPLHLNDSGDYSCRGINQYGSKEVIFTLTVLSEDVGQDGGQKLTLVPSNRTATQGESIKLECSVLLDQGTLKHVSWVKRDSLNQSITNDTVIQTTVYDNDESPVLYLPNISHDDQGLYTCIIINEGVEHCHTWLYVTSGSGDQSMESSSVHSDNMVVVSIIISLVTLIGIAVAAILVYRKCKSTRLSHQGATYFTVEKTSDSTHDLVT
ncbi:fibroblast growth factor receptor-like 1 [Ylistrum balloti]|uniref:fibroblast growth factor receptor-like 1 n=1 Tax=Ylistrum balloti TaxID=509963 RepID=UPI002905ED16|nr:fibroblast growth factor receptor-like 1 [Ylistrum balloti]